MSVTATGAGPEKLAPGSPYAQLFSVDDRQDSLVGSIAAWVGRAIIEGELEPGADLNSVELARRFNTSRTPVREALMLLEKEGIVHIPPRRRPYVAGISLDEVRDIFTVRAALLSLAVELIAGKANLEQLEQIRAAQEAQELAHRGDDVDVAFWSTLRFEDTVVDMCGNGALKRTLAPLRLRTLRLWRFLLADSIHLARVADIKRMVQALFERDARLAAELYRSLVLHTLGMIEQVDWAKAPIARPKVRRRASRA